MEVSPALKKAKLYIFDLDETLAESKQPIDTRMSVLLGRLLETSRIAVISGGAFPQFLKQVVARLPADSKLSNLYLLPTSGSALYDWSGTDWKKVYEERLSDKEAELIETAIRQAATETGLIDFSLPAWGERIEYRGGQVTVSALGQHAPLAEKKAWDPDHAKRAKLHEAIARHLPQFSVAIGGASSLDVTKRGVDKAYGIHQLCERLHLDESDALYVGDELRSGGNDEAVYKTDVRTLQVSCPDDTVHLLQVLLTTAA